MAVSLTHRNFRRLWIGAFASSIGTWMQKVAQAWLIVAIARSRSAFWLGLDSFLGEVPLLLLTIVGGVFADRRDRRHMIVMSQTIQMLVALTLGVLSYTRRIAVTHILALSFVAGCARAFGGPAYQALIPTLVGDEHLSNAIALNSIQFNVAQLIGPAVAGVTIAALGMAGCFGLNGVSFLFVIAAVVRLRDVHVPAKTTDRVFTHLRLGLRFVQCSRNLVAVITLGFFAVFLGAPLFTLLPVITKDVFHGDVHVYTRMVTFLGAGAVVGALIVAMVSKNMHIGRTLLIVLALFGTSIATFSLSRSTYLTAVALFLSGLFFVICSSLTTSLAQLLTPPEFRGRVVSIYLVAFLGGSPVGTLISGWFATLLGSAPLILVINGTVLTLLALYFLIDGKSRKRLCCV